MLNQRIAFRDKSIIASLSLATCTFIWMLPFATVHQFHGHSFWNAAFFCVSTAFLTYAITTTALPSHIHSSKAYRHWMACITVIPLICMITAGIFATSDQRITTLTGILCMIGLAPTLYIGMLIAQDYFYPPHQQEPEPERDYY